MADVLPPDVLHFLASHGPVRLVLGEGTNKKGLQCHVAPLDDCLYCFVEPGHPALRALLSGPGAEVLLSSEQDETHLRIKGRAVQGRSVMSSSRRSELLHWIPESADPRRTLLVCFWAEEVSFKKEENLFEGLTPLGRERKDQRAYWIDLAFGGMWPAVIFAAVCMWFWIAYAGNGEGVWQLYSLSISLAAVLTLQVGSNLLYRSACFRRFLAGRVLAESCPVLASGCLAHNSVQVAGFGLVATGIGLSVLLTAMDPLLLPVAAASSLLWVLWPLWGIHLLQKHPEAVEHEGRPLR